MALTHIDGARHVDSLADDKLEGFIGALEWRRASEPERSSAGASRRRRCGVTGTRKRS